MQWEEEKFGRIVENKDYWSLKPFHGNIDSDFLNFHCICCFLRSMNLFLTLNIGQKYFYPNSIQVKKLKSLKIIICSRYVVYIIRREVRTNSNRTERFKVIERGKGLNGTEI